MMCPDCQGKGVVDEKSCKWCHGLGEVPGPEDSPEEREEIAEAIEWNKSFGL